MIMNLFKKLYFTKSFCVIGESADACFGCSYCRASDYKASYMTLPSEINPLLTRVPVAVNLFHGDPLLQVESTMKILESLDDAGHEGIVTIITKGDVAAMPSLDFNLDIHVACSTFGVDSLYDGGNMKRFERNLSELSRRGLKHSTEFRPIIRDINDGEDVFRKVVEISSEYDSPVGYCGLQVNDALSRHIERCVLPFKPYDGHEFGLKKFISSDKEKLLRDIASEHDVPVFKKTSCLLSHVHGLERDYNAHYYRPNELGCKYCVMNDKCSGFKATNAELKVDLPFDASVINKERHVCILFKNGLCRFPTDDCTRISGKMLNVDRKITSSDLRVMKWLTGFTVDCNFEEIEFISDAWKIT